MSSLFPFCSAEQSSSAAPSPPATPASLLGKAHARWSGFQPLLSPLLPATPSLLCSLQVSALCPQLPAPCSPLPALLPLECFFLPINTAAILASSVIQSSLLPPAPCFVPPASCPVTQKSPNPLHVAGCTLLPATSTLATVLPTPCPLLSPQLDAPCLPPRTPWPPSPHGC